jgi:hypothetical protein
LRDGLINAELDRIGIQRRKKALFMVRICACFLSFILPSCLLCSNENENESGGGLSLLQTVQSVWYRKHARAFLDAKIPSFIGLFRSSDSFFLSHREAKYYFWSTGATEEKWCQRNCSPEERLTLAIARQKRKACGEETRHRTTEEIMFGYHSRETTMRMRQVAEDLDPFGDTSLETG